jgi:RNA polymerase sigma-70 factor (ECF subfamily)
MATLVGVLPDQRLVQLVRQKQPDSETEAFNELVRRHKADLRAAARRVTTDEDAVEDAVTDVFMALRTGAIRFDPTRGPLFPYLLVAVRHRLVDRYRRDRQRLQANAGVDPETLVDQEEPTLQVETKEELVAAIRGLSTLQRRVLLLRHLYGYRPREIAELLKIPSHRVSETLYAARMRVRERLEHPHGS